MNAWTWWTTVWDARERGTSLALFRIAVGLVVAVDALSLWVAGVVDPLLTPVASGGFATADRFPHPLVDLLGGPSEVLAHGLVFAVLALGVALTVGLGGRVVAFATLQVVLSLHALPIDIGGGYDRLITNALWLLVLGNGTATLSLDCRLRGRWTSDRLVAAFPRYLGIIQLIVVYVATGLAKTGPGWYPPFEAVYRSLQRWPWSRWGDTGALGALFPLTQLGTVVALAWEVSFFAVGLWLVARRGWLGARSQRLARFDLRLAYLGIGLVTHGALTVFLNLGPFTAITLCFYLLLFAPGEWDAYGTRSASAWSTMRASVRSSRDPATRGSSDNRASLLRAPTRSSTPSNSITLTR